MSGVRDSAGSRMTRGRIAGALAGVIVVGAFIALMVVGLLARDVDDSRIDQAIARGEPQPAPPLELPILANGPAIGRADGELLSLSELRGRPVVVNFWASCCEPCKREAPALEEAWRSGRSDGLIVLGVDVQDLSQEALSFIREFGQTYPHVRDREDDSYRAWGLTGVPETFFIDRAGRVRAHLIGEITSAQLAGGIELISGG